MLEQCHRCPFLLQTGAIGVGDVYVFLVVCFLHCAACGRRRMSPSARHKQGLVRQDRNPGFRSGNLYFLSGVAGEEIVRFPRRKRRRGVGGDELNWVNLGRVDPATLQATKIARGVKTCV